MTDTNDITIDHEPTEKFPYVFIPAHVWARKDLTLTEKVLMGRILSLSGKEGYCFASNEYLGKDLRLSGKHISRILTKFVRIGILRREVYRNEKLEITGRKLYAFFSAAGGGDIDAHRGMRIDAAGSNRELTIEQREINTASADSVLQDEKQEEGIEQLFYSNEEKSHSNWNEASRWKWNEDDWRPLSEQEVWDMAIKLNIYYKRLLAYQKSIVHRIKEGTYQVNSAWKYKNMAHAIERYVHWGIGQGYLLTMTEDERNSMIINEPRRAKAQDAVAESYRKKLFQK